MGRGSLRKQKRRGEERDVYLASARHKGRSVEKKKRSGGWQTGRTNKGGRLSRRGSVLLECFFVEQKEAMRGNKAAVKHTLTASPPLPPINGGCSINPPVIKSQGGAREMRTDGADWEEAGPSRPSRRTAGRTQQPPTGITCKNHSNWTLLSRNLPSKSLEWSFSRTLATVSHPTDPP